MRASRQRAVLILFFLFFIGSAIAIILYRFDENIIFFYSPSELLTKPIHKKIIRIGGLVKQDSAIRTNDQLEFIVTDGQNEIKVLYRGITPTLFKENSGVVAKGTIAPNHIFIAQEILAKHDENYMPREVSNTIKDRHS